jgi:predicted SprT family Zn-dependent metalloprotease
LKVWKYRFKGYICILKQTYMNTDNAKAMACELIKEHGLHLTGWHFQFDNSKRRFGVCKYRPKIIGLSMPLTLLNDEARVKNTILHEIAHALVGHAAGHGWQWQRKAMEIGCDGQRCYEADKVSRPKGNYEAVCGLCGHVHIKYKAPKAGRSVSCGKCSRSFNPNNLLIFKKV